MILRDFTHLIVKHGDLRMWRQQLVINENEISVVVILYCVL